jgi:uncharacterized protein YndB with AHSA1/START domain
VISLTNTVELAVPPARVWRLFRDMDSHYQEWIPEHLRWRWLSREPLTTGAVWHADEWVGPMRLDTRFEVIKAEPDRLFSWRILGFPARLVRTRGSFRLTPSDGGCRVDQEVHFGFSLPILGSLLDLAMALVLPLDEFRRHMREEQANLPRLLAGKTGNAR